MATIPSYYEGLLSPEDMAGLRSQALTAGLLTAGQALARSGAPSLTPGGGTGIADAAAGFYGGYQGTIDSALQNMIRGQQVQENIRKQKDAQRMRDMMAGIMTPQPTQIPMATGKGSQLEILSRPEFGGDMAVPETAAALRENLPMTPQIDTNRLLQVIAMTDPVEAAKLLVQKPTKLPGKIDEFVTAKQMGLIPQNMTLEAYEKIGKTPLVQVGAGDTALQKLDAEQIGSMSAKVNSAREAANTAATIENLLKGKGGGEVVRVGANLVQALGLPSETASSNALAQALQVRAATQVRAAGSGSTSDLEFKSFLSVFPSLGTSEQGRTLMAKGLRAFADRDALIERKARELFGQGKYSAAAIAEYDASLGAVLDPKVFGSINQGGGNTAGSRKDFRTPSSPR
jgi:hypothetical protein